MEGFFKVGEQAAARAPSAGSLDEQILQRAASLARKDSRFVVVDLDSGEVRWGEEQDAVRRGVEGVLERMYFHEIKTVDLIDMEYVKLVKKNGQVRVFSPALPKLAKELVRVLENNVPSLYPLKDLDTPLAEIEASEAPTSSDRSVAFPRFPKLTMLLISLSFYIAAAHLYLSPFTKVEESFNVQAVHDILRYPEGIFNRSVVREKYDHIEFPGVVPRTFWGPVILSSIIQIAHQFISLHENYSDLIVTRLTLGGLFTIMSTFRLARATVKAFPQRPTISIWFVLLTITQFHIPFYSTRLLPNTFATILVSNAHAELLEGRPRSALAILICTTVVFRCDMLILLGTTALYVWLSPSENRQSFNTLIKSGFSLFAFAVFWLLLSLLASIALDTHMWDKSPIYWPEGVVLFYNTVLNKSSNWGTSPFYYYWFPLLPRALLLSTIFLPFGASKVKSVSIPSLLFVALYSLLPHKEIRFLFPILPGLTVCAAVGLDTIVCWFNSRSKPITVRLFGWLVLAVMFLTCTMVVTFYSYLSSYNYPAGYALEWLNSNVKQTGQRIHIDSYSAMNGISRFLYRDDLSYSKKEGDVNFSDFDYLISNEPSRQDFEVIHIVKGEPKMALPPLNQSLDKILTPSHWIRTIDSVFVLKKTNRAGISVGHN